MCFFILIVTLLAGSNRDDSPATAAERKT
jgi:hypothetical protein